MNEHWEDVTVMLMLPREPVCRTGPLRVVGKVHTDPGFTGFKPGFIKHSALPNRTVGVPVTSLYQPLWT
jgi:hypothetical protein